MKHAQLTHSEIIDLKHNIVLECKSITVKKALKVLEAITKLLNFITFNLIKGGKLRIGIFDIPGIYNAGKTLVESILELFDNPMAEIKNGFQTMSVGLVLQKYIIWCFSNIITDGNKVKVPWLKIIPFVVRTIELIKDIANQFKGKSVNG